MSNDPFESPAIDEPPDVVTPSSGAIVFVVCIALFCGMMIFLGTCFGSGLIAFGYAYRNSNGELIFAGVWGGSGLLGVLSALFIGRNMYRRAQRIAARDAAISSEASEP